MSVCLSASFLHNEQSMGLNWNFFVVIIIWYCTFSLKYFDTLGPREQLSFLMQSLDKLLLLYFYPSKLLRLYAVYFFMLFTVKVLPYHRLCIINRD